MGVAPDPQFDFHAVAAAGYMKPFLKFPIADHYVYLNTLISTCANRLASRHQSDFYATRQGLVKYETDCYFATLIQKIWKNPIFKAMVQSKVAKSESKILIITMPLSLQASIKKFVKSFHN